MRKLIKILLIVCGVIAALMIVGSVAVSPVLKRYIERNGASLVGRNVTMDRLAVNVFTGGVAIRNFTMYEPDGTTPFVTFERFRTRIRLIPLLRSQLHIAHTTLSAPRLHVSQRGSAFNFDDLVSRFTDASDAANASTPAAASTWTLGIDGVSIRDGNVTYQDLSAGSTWNFEGMSLDIPGLTFGGGAARTGLDLRFANGGTIRSEVEYDARGERYDLRLRFDEFSVEGLLPYLQQTMNVSELAGTLTGELHIKGTTAHVMDFDVRGEAALNGISLLDDKRQPVIGIETLDADIRRINPAQSTAEFNLLAFSGVSAAFEVQKDGLNNFSNLVKSLPTEGDSDEPAVEESVSPVRIAVDNLRVTRSTLVYTDHTLPEPFCYTLSDIGLTAHNFDSGGRNRISLRAVMQQAGNLRAEWVGNIEDPADQRITLEIHNVSLRDLSPWSEAYFGYPVTGGTLSLTSRNQISDGMIDGANHVEIYRPQVGKRPRRSKPEYKIPLKTGLYVLADNRGRIDLDIPVSGEIGSPGFSYKKIAMGAFTNVITKVVTAPVRFMADALGFKNRQIDEIAFDPLQREFSAEQYAKFHELAEIVKNKPELKLSITQRVDFQSAIEQQSLDNLQKNCYARMRGLDDMSDVEPVDWRRADLKQRDLAACADAMLEEAKLRVKGNLAQKATALFGERSRDQVEEGIFLRNVLLLSHFTTRLGVPDDCVSVASETNREMKRNKDKNLFSVAIALPDEDDMLAETDGQ